MGQLALSRRRLGEQLGVHDARLHFGGDRRGLVAPTSRPMPVVLTDETAYANLVV